MSNKGKNAQYEDNEKQAADFQALLSYINELASHKMGYPVSLLTYLGLVNNKVLGIEPGTLANVLLNNVGDPFKDSETSLMEVKRHERMLIHVLENYYGLEQDEARGYVTTGGTEGNFAGLWWSKRFLINNAIDALIQADNAIKLYQKQEQELMVSIAKTPLDDFPTMTKQLQQLIGLKNLVHDNQDIVQQLLTPTVFFSHGHTHYSIAKIAEILRLNVRHVAAHEDGSINLNELEKEILLNYGAHPYSPVIVIANIGTTITGAIDDVPKINQILSKHHLTNSTIHLDGALTGFVLPILKPFGEIKNYFEELGVNTLAVSAHKYPGLSQPCGIILARRPFMEKAFEKSERNIDYVGNILDVTITGSRSGLNVLMFYHALITLGLHRNNEKLKEMVAHNLATARFLYEELVKIYGPTKVFYPYHFNVMFPRPSLALAKKYQLMLTGKNATICVLTNVTKQLIDEFIQELKLDREAFMQGTDYTIQPLAPDHVKATVELFTKTFCDSEPITRHLGIQYADYLPFANEVVSKAAKDGLSKVALDQKQRVIAFCIAEDLADPFIPKVVHYPKLQPIFSLLRALSRPFLQDKAFSEKKIAHVWVVAVDPAFRNQRVFTEIDLNCSETLARKGYGFAYVEFTSEISEKIIKQYGLYKLMNRIVYDKFSLENGQQPFKGLEGSASAYMIVIRPGINLSALEQCYKVQERL